MNIIDTPLHWLKIIQPTIYGDDRGFFMETYKQSDFAQAGIATDFVQDNHSKSVKWVLRGMHFQYHKPQVKLVRVVVWSVYDVAVDIRTDSPTYGQRYGIILSADNKTQLYIPHWFAHGFVSLEDDTEFIYKVSDIRDPTGEWWVMRDDPIVNIDWQTIFDQYGIVKPQLSSKDTNYQAWSDLPHYF
jgi:dTDP-4-dehydrorhamnose 3,5-epimerase